MDGYPSILVDWDIRRARAKQYFPILQKVTSHGANHFVANSELLNYSVGRPSLAGALPVINALAWRA